MLENIEVPTTVFLCFYLHLKDVQSIRFPETVLWSPYYVTET